MALRLGDIVLDRYVLHAKLGEGGFGTVWQAVDRVERRPVAIKALHANASAADRRRFEAEASILARLDHPHILALYDFTVTDDGDLLLVTELLGHDTLSDWVRKRLPDVGDVVEVSRQLCSALVAAHREGVLHRDLKPANVLVDTLPSGELNVTVLDFGIAKVLGREQPDITKTGEILGTPGYMSPEQLRGQNIGPATDLYCLGVIMFVMLEGRTPFAGESAMDVCMAHLTDRPPAVTRGPQALRRLVMQLLEKEASARPGSALAVDSLLARIQGGDHEMVLDDEPDAPWWQLPAALIALAALVVGAVIYAASDEERRAPPNPSPLPHALVAPAPASAPPTAAEQADVEEHAVVDDTGTVGCATKPVSAGRHSFLFDGMALERHDLLHYIPSSYDGRTPLPLVIVFHRNGATAEETYDETGFEPVAEENGFVLVVPQSGRRPYVPWIRQDRPRLDAMLDILAENLCLDRSRFYLVGLNEGDAALDHLLCRHRVSFAAVVGSGTRFAANDNCRKDGRATVVPRLEFENELDGATPIEGGAIKKPCDGPADYWPVRDHAAEMRRQHDCSGDAKVVEPRLDGVRCQTWDCAVPYEQCMLDEGRFWSSQPWQQHLACHGPPSTVPRARIAWQFLSGFRDRP